MGKQNVLYRKVHLDILGTTRMNTQLILRQLGTATSRMISTNYHCFTSKTNALLNFLPNAFLRTLDSASEKEIEPSLHWFDENVFICWWQNKELGILSKHDDEGNKNVTNLYICQMKNNSFAAFARAFFISDVHFIFVPVLSTTWNELFCRCVDGVSTWRQICNFIFFSLKRWYHFNSRVLILQL